MVFSVEYLYLIDELFVNAVLLVGLKERKQGLLLTHGAAGHHHRDAFQQGRPSIKGLVG